MRRIEPRWARRYCRLHRVGGNAFQAVSTPPGETQDKGKKDGGMVKTIPYEGPERLRAGMETRPYRKVQCEGVRAGRRGEGQDSSPPQP